MASKTGNNEVSLGNSMLAIGFLADVLYIKGILCYEELMAIYDASKPSDLENVFQRMMKNDFSPYKRGEVRSAYSSEVIMCGAREPNYDDE